MRSDKLVSTIGRGTSYLFAGVIATYFLGVLFKIFVARFVGPEGLGIVSLMMVIMGVFAIAFSLGLDSSATKYLAGFLARKKRTDIIVSTSIILTSALALIGAAVLFVFSEYLAVVIFNSDILILPFQLTSVALIFNNLQVLFKSLSVGYQKMENVAITDGIEKTSKILIVALLVFMGFGVMGPAYSIVFSFIVSTVTGLILFARKVRLKLTGFDKKIAKMLIKFGAPLTVAGGMGVVLSLFDSFFVGVFIDVANVGFYSTASSLYIFLGSLVGALSTSLFPAFSGIKARGNNKILKGVVNRSIKYVFYLMLPASLGLFMLAEPAIRILFGAEFYPAVLPLQILVFGSLFLALSKICTSFITGVGHPGTYTKYMVVSGVSNIVLNAMIIPVYGLMGAAFATTISLFVLFILCIVFVQKEVGVEIGYLHKPAISAVLMLVIIYFVRMYLLIGTWGRILAVIVLGAVSYFIFLEKLGGFDERDKKIIKIFVKKTMGVLRV